CSRPDEAGAPAGGATSESGTSAWQKPESHSQSPPSAESTQGSEVSGEGACGDFGCAEPAEGAAAVGAAAGDGASGMPELTSLRRRSSSASTESRSSDTCRPANTDCRPCRPPARPPVAKPVATLLTSSLLRMPLSCFSAHL